MALSRQLRNLRKQRCQYAQPAFAPAGTQKSAGWGSSPARRSERLDYMLEFEDGSIKPKARLTSREFRYRMMTSGSRPAASARPVPKTLIARMKASKSEMPATTIANAHAHG